MAGIKDINCRNWLRPDVYILFLAMLYTAALFITTFIAITVLRSVPNSKHDFKVIKIGCYDYLTIFYIGKKNRVETIDNKNSDIRIDVSKKYRIPVLTRYDGYYTIHIKDMNQIKDGWKPSD